MVSSANRFATTMLKRKPSCQLIRFVFIEMSHSYDEHGVALLAALCASVHGESSNKSAATLYIGAC